MMIQPFLSHSSVHTFISHWWERNENEAHGEKERGERESGEGVKQQLKELEKPQIERGMSKFNFKVTLCLEHKSFLGMAANQKNRKDGVESNEANLNETYKLIKLVN